MTTTTIGKNYQVVFPEEIRVKLDLHPSSKVNIEVQGHCVLIYPAVISRMKGIGRDIADTEDATDQVKQLRAGLVT